MNVQSLEFQDLPFLDEVQPPDWPDIIPHFDYYTRSPFCSPIKVMINGKIAGIGCTIVHQDVAWLAHIIVSPQHRNKGIGQHITQRLVEFSKIKSCSTIYLIATDLGAPVYEKIGFETETDYLFFKDLEISSTLPRDKNIFPFQPAFAEQIVLLDRKMSGENRMMQLTGHLESGSVYQANGMVEGYYLPSFGEGLIIADTSSAGIALMKARMSTHEKASFPVENTQASEFLYQQGYKEFKTAKRMWLGIRRDWHPEKIYNRIGGNVG